jgi:hypothetical protein
VSALFSLLPAAIVALVAASVIFPHAAFAQSAVSDNALAVAEESGLATTDIRTFAATVVRAFFGLLGIMTVAYMMYAGYLWMTAGGNQEQIAKSQAIIKNASIGLAIIFMAFAIAEFIFRVILGVGAGTSGAPGSGGGAGNGIGFGPPGSDALGNGVIEYHFPEPSQTNVARNTRISITFKQPLVLSTVFKDYDDKNTFTTADDVVPSPLILNDNLRVAAVSDLGDPGAGTIEEQFAQRYDAAAGTVPELQAKVTQVAAAFNPDERQTLVIMPQGLLGSPVGDVNYRVALRGGTSGIRVWDMRGGSTQPVQINAFARMFVDGAYSWTFATGTNVDVTPPKISAVVPEPAATPSSDPMVRNQLVQVYFNEAVDPTTVSGEITEKGGNFAKLAIEARCESAKGDCEPRYLTEEFVPVPGTFVIGNKFRTAEFTPATPCDGVSENSCGQTVYCLPRNVELRVRALAASVGDAAPLADSDDGILDMVGNSLDGNDNGKAEGPQSDKLALAYSLNRPTSDLDGVSDTADAMFLVGDEVDLVPPQVIDIDPKSASEVGSPDFSTPYTDGGPSQFPVDRPVGITWDKVLSITSLRTGAPEDPTATVSLDSTECRKDGEDACGVGTPCTCTELAPPYFFLSTGVPQDVGGDPATRLSLEHRVFATANQLGYTEDDIAVFPNGIPRYVPILRATIRDSRQNCFFPSVGYACPAGTMTADGGATSCCDRTALKSFSCP